MIVATFPILIGLGVDYALHMVNRVEERRRHHIDAAHSENMLRRRRGEDELPVPDLWDMTLYRTCVLEMTRSTGLAVLLSAFTTVIGFSVLMVPQIVAVTPIRSVGVTLVLGIVHACFQPPAGADLGLAASLQQKIDPGGVGESGSSTRQALVRRGRGGVPDHRGRRGQPRRAVRADHRFKRGP